MGQPSAPAGPGEEAGRPEPDQLLTAGAGSRPGGRALARARGVIGPIGHNRALARLQIAFLAMTLAEYGEWIALLVYAYGHGGASAAGLVAIAQLVPSMVLAPLINAHGARLGVARLLVASYLAAAVMLAGAAAAIVLHAPPLVAYAAAVCFTVALGVSVPLHNVMVPLVVRHPDELTAANVTTGWCKGMGALAGPLLAGLLIGLQGPGLACGVLAALCLCAPLLANVRPVRAAPETEQEGAGAIADLIGAARVIASRPNTRALIAYRAGAAAIEGAIDLLVVLLAVKILLIGPAAAGYLSAAFGAGGLIGASAAMLLLGRRLAIPLAGAALLGAAALAALALASTTLVAVLLLVLVGATRSLQSIASQTLLQRSTPLDVIVCVFALVESMRDAGLAFGSLLVPLLVALGGADAAFLGTASFAPLVVLLTLRRLRSMDREASIPLVEMGLLRNLPVFSALAAAPLETLARESTYLSVPAGAAVIREGEEGDRYYAITGGEVLVTKEHAEIRRMGRGEGFGEIALLYPVQRTATVSALTSVTLLAVDRDAFLAALDASPHVHAAAGHVAGRRLAEAP